ncbi:MAG TPA: hypothetical protein VI893_05435 [Thermoplasmata archaeon]|nr:hypothetical protein [Thermoplasmata archaeon]
MADTGADASLLPLGLGKLIVRNVVSGKRHMVSGVVPGAGQAVYFHRLEFRIGRRTFAAPTLIADSDDCPAILGRAGALDRWTATFSRGRSLRIRK